MTRAIKAPALPRRIGLRSAGMTLTPEEFDALPESAFDDRYHYELVRGVLVVTPPAGIGERHPNDYLGYLLWDYQENHPQGSALNLTAPEQTVGLEENRRRCDRAIWAGLGRLPDPDKDLPTIVIEFVSFALRDWRRDYEEKRQVYLALGVKEYWIIDRFDRKMEVSRNTAAGVQTIVIQANQTYQTDILPGFVLSLERLMSQADRWTKKKPRRRRPPSPGAE